MADVQPQKGLFGQWHLPSSQDQNAATPSQDRNAGTPSQDRNVKIGTAIEPNSALNETAAAAVSAQDRRRSAAVAVRDRRRRARSKSRPTGTKNPGLRSAGAILQLTIWTWTVDRQRFPQSMANGAEWRSRGFRTQLTAKICRNCSPSALPKGCGQQTASKPSRNYPFYPPGPHIS